MEEMIFFDQDNNEYTVLNISYYEEFDNVYALYYSKDDPTSFFIASVIEKNNTFQFIDIEDKKEFETIKDFFESITDNVVEQIKQKN